MWLRKISFFIYGLSNFTKSGYEKSTKYMQEKIETYDLTGKKIMITGANSGLGFCSSKFMAKQGATVYMICRNKERGEKAQEEIIKETNNENVKLIICDVSIKQDIRDMVDTFIKEEKGLDVLINNAGVLLLKRSETKEGIETTLATNSISSFLLSKLLLPVLEKSEDPRIIFVSSGGGMTEKLLIGEEYEKDLMKGEEFDGITAYARTKRQQIVMNEIFAKKYENTNIRFLCCHPGWSETPGVKESMPDFYEKLEGKFRTVEQGTDVINWLSVSKELKKEYNGEWFRDRQIERKHFVLSGTCPNEKEVASFWEWLHKISDETF